MRCFLCEDHNVDESNCNFSKRYFEFKSKKCRLSKFLYNHIKSNADCEDFSFKTGITQYVLSRVGDKEIMVDLLYEFREVDYSEDAPVSSYSIHSFWGACYPKNTPVIEPVSLNSAEMQYNIIKREGQDDKTSESLRIESFSKEKPIEFITRAEKDAKNS